jgi:succinoglycan biosynthesis protein ExoA
MEPFLTIVMPVRNEARFIADTLQMLLRQDYPGDRFEIIVADGSSDDGTIEIVQEMAARHPQIRLVANEKRRSSAGRNLGFRLGKGDYFLVVDGHCHIDNDRLFLSIVECFERSGADCLGRPQPLDPPGLTPFQEAVALARASFIGHSCQSLIYANYEGFASAVSNGAVFRREVFEKVGYVDERMDACEDVEFNYRLEKAGLRGYTSPALTVRYYPRENLSGLYRQMHRYGLGRYRFLQRHPESFHWETLVPPLFVLGLFLLLTSATSVIALHLTERLVENWPSPGIGFVLVLAATLFGLYLFYLCMIAGASVLIAVEEGRRHLKYLPLIFCTIHFGMGCGFLAGLWSVPQGDVRSNSEDAASRLQVPNGKAPP